MMKTPYLTLADRLRAAPDASASPSRAKRLVERPLDALGRQLLKSQLRRLRHGRITLIDGEHTERYGIRSAQCPLSATVHVRERRFYAELAFGGSVGAGESYMAGDWWSDNLTALVRILLHNRELLEGMDGGFARVTEPLRKMLHATARNTRAGSRRNIGAHYDLGNDFFALVLDPSMMYSSAVFERPDMSLHEASIAKLDLICKKLKLSPQDHVLEIGTGWGSFAIHAARHYGCRVTTTTISREQHDWARDAIKRAGLTDRITLKLEDYRDLKGQYDKLVSIEMIEAVGHQYYDTFFNRCSQLLRPHGSMLLQAITIADQQYEAARDSVDFIKRHIFPGCCIPAVSVLSQSIARATDMRIVGLEDIGPHYATTLARWRDNMFEHIDRVRALGYPDTFIRMWEFYLCYCEGGFAERALGDVQMLLDKPLAR
jgi:cyclopropane-fatty-acyl-phospholipid synthase